MRERKKYTISLEGESMSDIELGLQEATRLIRAGYHSGADSNDTGSYHIDSEGAFEEPEHIRSKIGYEDWTTAKQFSDWWSANGLADSDSPDPTGEMGIASDEASKFEGSNLHMEWIEAVEAAPDALVWGE